MRPVKGEMLVLRLLEVVEFVNTAQNSRGDNVQRTKISSPDFCLDRRIIVQTLDRVDRGVTSIAMVHRFLGPM
jgi:hypothetical protein